MRFMILVKATRDSEAGKQPPESLFAEMAAYHEALAKAEVTPYRSLQDDLEVTDPVLRAE